VSPADAWEMSQDPGWVARRDVWTRWRLGLGWPHAGGWADQLAWVAEAVMTFELLSREHDREEGDKKKDRKA